MKFQHIFSALVAITTGVSAADLPSRPAPPAAFSTIPASQWAGFYAGVHAGSSFSAVKSANPATGTATRLRPGAAAIGLLAGFNHHNGRLVAGIEAGFSAHVGRQARFTNIAGPVETTRDRWTGRLRGRIGYNAGNALIFAAAGFSAGNFGHTLAAAPPAAPARARKTYTSAGFNLGAGIEYALKSGWTGRAEYIFDHYGKSGVTFAGPFGPRHMSRHSHTFRLAVIRVFAPSKSAIRALY